MPSCRTLDLRRIDSFQRSQRWRWRLPVLMLFVVVCNGEFASRLPAEWMGIGDFKEFHWILHVSALSASQQIIVLAYCIATLIAPFSRGRFGSFFFLLATSVLAWIFFQGATVIGWDLLQRTSITPGWIVWFVIATALLIPAVYFLRKSILLLDVLLGFTALKAQVAVMNVARVGRSRHNSVLDRIRRELAWKSGTRMLIAGMAQCVTLFATAMVVAITLLEAGPLGVDLTGGNYKAWFWVLFIVMLVAGTIANVLSVAERRRRIAPIRGSSNIPDDGILLLRHNKDDDRVLQHRSGFYWHGELRTFEVMLCDQLAFSGKVHALLLDRNTPKRTRQIFSRNRKALPRPLRRLLVALRKLLKLHLIRSLYLPLGAQRYDLIHRRGKWKDFVMESMCRAKGIVLIVGAAHPDGTFVSDHLVTEIRRLQESGLLVKTVFVFPQVAPADALSRWTAFMAIALPGRPLSGLPDGNRILGVFFVQNVPVLVLSRHRRERAYHALLDLSASVAFSAIRDDESALARLGLLP